jgi:hypothetical protein
MPELTKQTINGLEVLKKVLNEDFAGSNLDHIQIRLDECNYIYISKKKPPKQVSSPTGGVSWNTSVKKIGGWYVWSY